MKDSGACSKYREGRILFILPSTGLVCREMSNITLPLNGEYRMPDLPSAVQDCLMCSRIM
jgi:hypothetical protein